jgi:hypothetical protein
VVNESKATDVGGRYIMRVTVDIDGTGFLSRMRVVIDWLALKAISRGAQYGRRSARGKFHLKCHYLRISFRTSLLLRLLLGDDKMRVKLDIRRTRKPKQILWSEKDHKPATRWTQSLLEVMV